MIKVTDELKLFYGALGDFRKRIDTMGDLNVAFSHHDKRSLILMFEVLIIERENIQDELDLLEDSFAKNSDNT